MLGICSSRSVRANANTKSCETSEQEQGYDYMFTIMNKFLVLCLKGKMISVVEFLKHRRKSKGETIVTLEMARQLRDKNIEVIPGHAFCRQCVKEFDDTINKSANESDVDDVDVDVGVNEPVSNECESEDDEYELCETQLNTCLEFIVAVPQWLSASNIFRQLC